MQSSLTGMKENMHIAKSMAPSALAIDCGNGTVVLAEYGGANPDELPDLHEIAPGLLAYLTVHSKVRVQDDSGQSGGEMSVRRPEGESTVHKLLNESDPGPGFRGRSDTIAKRMVTELDMELGEGNPIRYDCLLVSENGLAAFDRKRIFPDNERYAVFPGSSGMAEESLRQCYGELSWLKGGVPSESDLVVLAAYAVEGRGVAGYGKGWEPDERTRVRIIRKDESGRFSQTAVKGKTLKDYAAAHLPDFSQPPQPRQRADASQLFGGRKVCEVAALQPRYAEQPAEWEPLRQGK